MAEEILASVQVRRDNKANWEAVNPVLLDGEAAYEKDTDMFKIGDGVKRYSDLPYHNKVGPKGDTGATPQISMRVSTGAAGSEASVSVSGTAENPLISLTIPRGDTGASGVTKETDPTVPDWAKQPNKPSYTAQEVGADSAGAASTQIATHNTNTSAHADIRTLISDLTNRFNALADSDDTTLDQLSEIVAYIKSNKTLIDTVTTSKVNVSDIVNNLTTNASGKVLSAAQGVKLKAMINGIVIPTTLPNPQPITINGQRYDGSEAVTLTPEDLGAATAEEVSQLKADKLGKDETAADSAKLGGKAPEYYLQPRNLLDNSDFTNPVNQRNAGTVVNDYVVDRWYGFKTTDGSVSITPDGITATGDGYLQHRLPSGTLKSGVVYTIAVYYSDGSIDVNTNGEYAIMDQYDVVNNIKPNGKTIAHVALYEGSYTAETLPPYVPKGYSAELAECQRYYQIIRLYRHLSTIYDNEYRYYGCPLPVKMRAKPAVTIIIMEEIKVNSFDKNILTSYSGESYSSFEGMAISFICKSEFGTVLSQCYVSAKIACTADL